MPEKLSFEIYWRDLCWEKQEEFVDLYGDPEDVFEDINSEPLAVIVFEEEG